MRIHLLLTCVDRFPRWPEAIPLTSSITAAAAQAFLSGCISHVGVPTTIVTDRGRQFESQLWSTLMTLLGSKRARTTSYHPQTNGMVECFHRQLKAALKAQPQPDSLDGRSTTWKPHRSQSGHILHCCRDGVWQNSPSSRRVLRPLSNIFFTGPIGLCFQPQNSYAGYSTFSTSSYIIDGLSTATHVLSGMMLSASYFNHHTMDGTHSSKELINTSPST